MPAVADTDGGGIKDGAETATLPTVADSDDDGWGDGAEVEFGGNPMDSGNLPRFAAKVSIPNGSSNLVLRFPSATGQSYVLKASTLLSGWETLESGIPGTGNVIERTISRTGFPARFFKVGRNGP